VPLGRVGRLMVAPPLFLSAESRRRGTHGTKPRHHAPWERMCLKCTTGPTTTFFTLEAHSPQRAMGHVAALEPSSAGSRGPKPREAWQHRSPPQRGGGVQSCRTHGNTGALLGREVRSGATRHVAASELSSAGRWGPELRDMWQHRSPPR
jgi:hypothetical protein